MFTPRCFDFLSIEAQVTLNTADGGFAESLSATVRLAEDDGDPQTRFALLNGETDPGLWQGGYVFDAVVLSYPRSGGVFDPGSAEWVVLLASGWLEWGHRAPRDLPLPVPQSALSVETGEDGGAPTTPIQIDSGDSHVVVRRRRPCHLGRDPPTPGS